jgi:choline dehydrogenase-like flavoprotein
LTAAAREYGRDHSRRQHRWQQRDALTALRDALLTGKVSVRPDSHVFRLNMGNGGRAVESVAFLDEDGKTRQLTADVFVLAASAIESARLCLLSGFSNPLIGANLMFHRQTTAIGIFAQQLHGHRGRTASYLPTGFATNGIWTR